MFCSLTHDDIRRFKVHHVWATPDQPRIRLYARPVPGMPVAFDLEYDEALALANRIVDTIESRNNQ